MESDPAASYYIIGLAISFLLSTFFSIIKIIFASVERALIPSDDEHLRFYASKIESYIEDQRALFSSIVATSKTFANIAFSVLLLSYLSLIRPDLPTGTKVLLAIGISFITLSLGAHYIPRAFCMRYFRSYVAVAYTAYKIFGWIFLPFASLFLAIHQWILKLLRYDEKFSFLSEEDKARMTETNDTEALDEEEREMIRSIFDLGDTTVDEIMVPRIDIIGLDICSDFDTVIKMVKEEGHSRIPVFKETIDSIVGILYAKDILSWIADNKPENWNLKPLIKKPHFVPIGKMVNELMREFKLKHIHLAVVVDEYGGTAGIVTMEDILEQIVGDIQDEYDEEENQVVQLDTNTYLIDPHIDLRDLNEELNVALELEDVDYNTLGGLIYHEYGDVPQENTEFEYSGLRIIVLKMDHQRIEKVKVQVLQRPDSVEIDSL